MKIMTGSRHVIPVSTGPQSRLKALLAADQNTTVEESVFVALQTDSRRNEEAANGRS